MELSRRILLATLLVAGLAFLCAGATAQCTPHVPCTGGDTLACRTAPQIGTNWTLCQVGLGSVRCSSYAYVFGDCFDAGIPVPPPIACASCPRCTLNVSPVFAGVTGGNCLTLPIPRDPTLVGAILCAQGACLQATCLCLSSSVQVQIQP